MPLEININDNLRRLIRKGKQTFSKKLINTPNAKPGDVIKLKYGNSFLAYGAINPKDPKNYLRIISLEEDIDNFIYSRIKYAKKFREKTIGYNNHYRLLYSESDYTSGLIIDRYNDIFVINNSNIYFDKNINKIAEFLKDIFGNNITIYEKSIGKQRERAGMLPKEGYIYGDKKYTLIEENRKKFFIDVILGQKTGFFLDQRENRKILSNIEGEKILDVFSYTGSLGITIKGDYKVFIEKDKKAIEILKKNVEINDINNYKIINRNAYQALIEMIKNKEKFDIIILDPPDLLADGYEKGIKNFALINSLAIDLIDDGYLITFSCSQDLKENKILAILKTIIRRKGKKFEIIQKFRQSMDHKVIFPHRELEYLRGFMLHIYK